MKENSNGTVALGFDKLDFHDDALASVTICPSRRKTHVTKIDFEFLDDSTGAKKFLSFRGCANLRFIMDFDVLADNWFAQTEGVTSKIDSKQLRKFVRAQMAHWHVDYMAPSPKNRPIRRKLLSIRSYVLFKLRFFGGTVEVLAKDFVVKPSRKT
jgi:hypothetical protein